MRVHFEAVNAALEGANPLYVVVETDVPQGFMMYVPVKVDFGARGVAYVRILVKGPETEVTLPLLPQKPDDIVLDPDESVLADVRSEGWH